jgi:hypothetical protein
MRSATDEELTPVALRVDEHRFRIPYAYFRYPPSRSGVDDGFYIRAQWPTMEPETAANRGRFRSSLQTDEGQRLLQIVLNKVLPTRPPDVARWMLQNSARGSTRPATGPKELDEFLPATAETFGLRVQPGQRRPNSAANDDDLYYGALSNGRFAGGRCNYPLAPTMVTTCQFWFEWGEGAVLRVSFGRQKLPEWRAMLEDTLNLVKAFAVPGARQ